MQSDRGTTWRLDFDALLFQLRRSDVFEGRNAEFAPYKVIYDKHNCTVDYDPDASEKSFSKRWVSAPSKNSGCTDAQSGEGIEVENEPRLACFYGVWVLYTRKSLSVEQFA